MEHEFTMSMSDGHQVFLKKWHPEGQDAKAVMQLSHGMAEHIGRYQPFAEFLANHGFIVYGNDHRGHGKTGQQSGNTGFLADHDGFERVVDDMHEINGLIHGEFPNVPVFLLGHSMGSFLARRYVQRFHGRVQGVILTGTAGSPGFPGRVGKILAQSQVRKLGKLAPSEKMNQLMFGNYNKSFANVRTPFDWLSRDHREVDKYVNDPLCGFVCSSGFYVDLLTGLFAIHRDSEISKIEKELPFLFLSGSDDPVGHRTKGVQQAVQQLQRRGITNVEVKFYDGARHELFQETNRDEVFQEIYQWLEQQLKFGTI
ncbi:alpha/beta hydrolase [Alicyclobacillus sp. SO9]|uniref:alpha/beta hydrolase n=1 Tax=Alicyclobacillus sp. SO9 TaxID=2665646 RepID=UPI0018E6F34E|nr:alpha/beta hydrolase [Alicyclobacillus sp. SO9]QQE80597.1 lysophospholipase [Alicyclobacillus sp. SO9]